jgi:2-polyprenyl-6-methoxyphenol hydroxylase-like FAD-dependent oxidoreductase
VRVLIVGAGVGGLAAARALSADGHDIVVFEQAAGPREGGAAVTLWSNGTGILGELNVSLDGVGGQIDMLEQRDYRARCSSPSTSVGQLPTTGTRISACRAGGCSNGWPRGCRRP